MLTVRTGKEVLVMKKREILFHGKQFDSDEWIEGAFIPDALESVMGQDVDWGFIRRYNSALKKMETVEVERNSVGQYVGIINIPSGRKLFEGSVLRHFDNEVQVVEWNDDFKSIMLHTYAMYEVKRGRKTVLEFQEGWCDLEDYPLEEMKYLGNVYANPELIERDNLIDPTFV